MSFNVGEVVRLNSGGPKMTVKSVKVICQWYENTTVLREGEFMLSTIHKVSDEEKEEVDDIESLIKSNAELMRGN